MNYDPEAIEEYHVTRQDVENARRYVALLQGEDSQTYRDIAAGCYYATSALLHEVVELRILLGRDRRLLQRRPWRVKHFLQENKDAHVKALMVEYAYLQHRITNVLGEELGLGDLVIANSRRWWNQNCRSRSFHLSGPKRSERHNCSGN